jgi:DeoR/GlpR family transcriptional regulator of sugar metabolism
MNLAVELGVSDMTIRRDLDKLEQQDVILRTHGGAYSNKEMVEVDFHIRETVCLSEKQSIGQKAFSILQQGESIFIDAGSTTFFLASSIDDTKRLTVVTHSIVVAQSLLSKVNVDTILLGGKVHNVTQSLIGPLTEESIRKFKFTKAFLGTSGINLSEGFTATTLEEIPIKKRAAINSKQVIVLADSTKLNRNGLSLFLEFSDVDMIITDTGIEKSECDRLEKD